MFGQAQLGGGGEQHVGETARVQIPQGVDHRLLEPGGLVAGGGVGNIVAPILQVHPVGEEQIGHNAGIVDKGGEADDEQIGGAFDGVAQAEGWGEAVDRVGVVEQEHTDIAAADALRQASEIIQRRGGGGGWHAVPRCRGVKDDAAGGADAADKPVKGGGGL